MSTIKCKQKPRERWNLVSYARCQSNKRPLQISPIIFFFILGAKYIKEREHWIANLPELMDKMNLFELLLTSMTFPASTLKLLSSYILMRRLEWRHWTQFVSGCRRRSLASVSPCHLWGGEGEVRLHVAHISPLGSGPANSPPSFPIRTGS